MSVFYSFRWNVTHDELCHPQGFNTSLTLVLICQNEKFDFSFLTLTYLGLLQGVTCTIGTFGFWYVQRYWKISTKKMVGASQ